MAATRVRLPRLTSPGTPIYLSQFSLVEPAKYVRITLYTESQIRNALLETYVKSNSYGVMSHGLQFIMIASLVPRSNSHEPGEWLGLELFSGYGFLALRLVALMCEHKVLSAQNILIPYFFLKKRGTKMSSYTWQRILVTTFMIIVICWQPAQPPTACKLFTVSTILSFKLLN